MVHDPLYLSSIILPPLVCYLLFTSLMAGKVLIPLGLLAAVFSTAGQYIGAGLALKNGSKIVRPVILVVLVLLAVKVFLEFFGIG